MRRPFFSLSELIKERIAGAGLKGAVREKAALKLWTEVVGAKTASVTNAERVQKGILYVSCKDSMWAQQLHFLRPVIIKKLNERLGEDIIKEIRLSGRGYTKTTTKEGDGQAEKPYEQPELSATDVQAIDAAVEGIENPELAEQVRNAMKAARALLKKKASEANNVESDRPAEEDR